MIKLTRVLCPTDLSPAAGEALIYGATLASQFGAELHILSVVQDADFVSPDPNSMFLIPASNLDEVVESVRKALNGLPLDDYPNLGKVVREAIKGNPYKEIAAYAKRADIDLIVIGTHGRTGLMHMLLGSNAEKIVRSADCPVLTVRAEGHQFV